MLLGSVVTLRTQTDSDADLLYRIASDLDTWEERGPLPPAPLTRPRSSRIGEAVSDTSTCRPARSTRFVR